MRAVFATRPEPYVVLKDLMEDRRRDLQEELRSLRETLPAEIVDVKDAEEQSLDDLMRELNFALMEMKSDALRQIDEAIRRLESSRVIRDETEPHGGCESDSNCRGATRRSASRSSRSGSKETTSWSARRRSSQPELGGVRFLFRNPQAAHSCGCGRTFAE